MQYTGYPVSSQHEIKTNVQINRRLLFIAIYLKRTEKLAFLLTQKAALNSSLQPLVIEIKTFYFQAMIFRLSCKRFKQKSRSSEIRIRSQVLVLLLLFAMLLHLLYVLIQIHMGILNTIETMDVLRILDSNQINQIP